MTTDTLSDGTGLLLRDGEAVEQILAAAESCFGHTGYDATTMRRIAEAAGVSKSLLHYHFQSKEHLFLEVLVRVYDRLARQVAESVQGQGSVTDRVLGALDALLESFRRDAFFQVQAQVWARSLHDERLRAHAKRIRERLREEIVQTLSGILGPAAAQMPLSLEAAADLLWATTGGLGLQSSIDDPARIEEAFQGFRRLVALALSSQEIERAEP